MMNTEELLNVLRETNKRKGSPVDEEILKAILSIVILNPLDESRGKSQDQIHYVLSKMKMK
jgi:hypothetical protein